MDWMKDDGIFMPMLNDTGRNQFYQQALQQIAPGSTVCDIGAGTGFLSVMAAKFGAKQVYAVEKEFGRYQYLTTVINKLGLQDQIQVLFGDFLQHDIAADVYVSETINTQIFGEDMVKLSNHATRYGGKFIPSGFEIWAEVYENHPVFILDLTNSEAYEYDSGIDVDNQFKNVIDNDFGQQYTLDQTIYTANNLNRLFTMLPNFTDLKLNCLGRTDSITVDLNQPVDEKNIKIFVPFNLLRNKDHALVVVKWRMFYNNISMNSDNVWFGNVAKPIRQKFRTQDQIEFCYDPDIKNWRLKY